MNQFTKKPGSKYYLPFADLAGSACENVLNDEFRSSNNENNIKNCLALSNRTFVSLEKKHDIILYFYHITETKSFVEGRWRSK